MIKKWMIPQPDAVRPCPQCSGLSIGVTAICSPRHKDVAPTAEEAYNRSLRGMYDYWNEWICKQGHVWRGGVIDPNSIQEVRPAE